VRRIPEVNLTTDNTDHGIVRAVDAYEIAKEVANQEGKVVTLRHPNTDEVLATITPGK
jgi:hypothetical protein